jgi:hypothetical protein
LDLNQLSEYHFVDVVWLFYLLTFIGGNLASQNFEAATLIEYPTISLLNLDH